MKTITIGRGDGCNITIDDDMMSRRHAILKVPTFGKMEIVDMSKNGTFVNGVKLRPNVPFPVSRKDVINFANVHQLDWSEVPDPLKYYKIGAIVVAVIIALAVIFSIAKGLFKSDNNSDTPYHKYQDTELYNNGPSGNDSLKNKKESPNEQQAKPDSPRSVKPVHELFRPDPQNKNKKTGQKKDEKNKKEDNNNKDKKKENKENNQDKRNNPTVVL